VTVLGATVVTPEPAPTKRTRARPALKGQRREDRVPKSNSSQIWMKEPSSIKNPLETAGFLCLNAVGWVALRPRGHKMVTLAAGRKLADIAAAVIDSHLLLAPSTSHPTSSSWTSAGRT
jgi:hypothetical protein